MMLMRRLLLAMALAVAATLAVPAGPARADLSTIKICELIEIDYNGSTIEFWHCYPVTIPVAEPDLVPPWPDPDPCLSCPPVLNIWDELDRESRQLHLYWRGEGLRLLSEAAVTEDPGQVEELRIAAQQAFITSAEILGDSPVEVHSVGWVDVENEYTFHEDWGQSALTDAAQHLVEGLRLTQHALGDPDPEPNLEEAMAHFDAVHENLAGLYAG